MDLLSFITNNDKGPVNRQLRRLLVDGFFRCFQFFQATSSDPPNHPNAFVKRIVKPVYMQKWTTCKLDSVLFFFFPGQTQIRTGSGWLLRSSLNFQTPFRAKYSKHPATCWKQATTSGRQKLPGRKRKTCRKGECDSFLYLLYWWYDMMANPYIVK